MEKPDKESGLSALENVARRARASSSTGFGNLSETPQEDKAKQDQRSARLIIGAADRIENLLPKK